MGAGTTTQPDTAVKIRIDAIRIGTRHRKAMGEIDVLAESIREIGLLQAIGVTKDNTLVFGQRRIEACKSLGWEEIPAKVIDDSVDAVAAEHDENECRLEFTINERAACYRMRKEREEERAKERKKAAGGARGNQHTGGKPRVAGQGNFPQPAEVGKAADIAAKSVGMDRKTAEKAVAVIEAAEADPDMFGDLPELMDDTGKVSPAHAEMERRKAGDKPTKPAAQAWHVNQDRGKMLDLFEKLQDNWKTDFDKSVMREFFKQLATRIY